MATLSIKKLNSDRAVSIPTKRVGSDGNMAVLRTLDATSGRFGDQLRNVFRLNVARARRENKRALGFTDIIPADG